MSSKNNIKPTILYVDDEKINLENFRTVFLNDFNVITASSGKQAISRFQQHQHQISAIVSDQRMPGMTGTELLSTLYEINPLPSRMILTAYSDFQELSDAVNLGRIYAWVQKPWEYLTLKPTLLRACENYAIYKENEELIDTLSKRNNELREELQLRNIAETKRREAEIRMLAQSKLASLGEMATGIAHEINQPLTYVKILLEATERDIRDSQLDTNELMKKEIPEALNQIQRISTIIDHLRVFNSSDSISMQAAKIEHIITSSLVPIRQKLIKENIDLQLNISSVQELYLKCDPLRIEQVFVNLFSNSIDALSDKYENKIIRISADIVDDFISLIFYDNGCGMNSQTLERIFEPFYTTKEVGKGTGIGLSISHSIIREHGGTISCTSSPGATTTFTIQLPLYKE